MGSDGGDEFACAVKKLKPHKKIFEDGSRVDGASIPRKLRSVIKKRTCHAISQPRANLKNHVNGFDTTGKDCVKKPKTCMFNPEKLSKDEEEVAETLYALAGTAPRRVTSLEKKSDSESPSGRQMHSKKLDDSLLSPQGPQTTPEEAVEEETSNQTSEELLKDSKPKMNVGDLGKSMTYSQPKLSQTTVQQNLNASLQVNHQSLASTSLGTKKNYLEQRETVPSQRVSENSYVMPQIVDHTSQDQIKKSNGSILMPSLLAQTSHGPGGADGFPSQFSATKLPYWLHSVASSSASTLQQSQASHKKESEVENNKKRRIKNSCPTHVYISRFIKLSQKSEHKENSSLVERQQITPCVGATLGVMKTLNHLNHASHESTPMVPDRLKCNSFSEKNILNASNDAILIPGRSVHGQEHASLAPGNSALRQQCFDFFSLSTGGGETEPRVETSRNGTQLNPLAGFPVPQLQPLTRYDSVPSLPLPPNLIPLNSYQSQRSTSAQSQPPVPQAHLQLPSYFSRSNQLDSSTASFAKQQQLQPPQQYSTWMTQSAAQYRVGTIAPPQIAHWQSSRQQPYIVQQYTQAQTPSQSSLPPGAQFPKYFQMPQQHHHQQKMLRISPFPPIQTNSQHSPVPVCGDKTVR